MHQQEAENRNRRQNSQVGNLKHDELPGWSILLTAASRKLAFGAHLLNHTSPTLILRAVKKERLCQIPHKSDTLLLATTCPQHFMLIWRVCYLSVARTPLFSARVLVLETLS